MTTAKAPSSKKRKRDNDRYMELVRLFPLRPIRTKRDYAAATKAMEQLAIRGEDVLNTDEQDYLDVLTDLVEAFDNEHHPEPDAGTPLDLRYGKRIRIEKPDSRVPTKIRYENEINASKISASVAPRRHSAHFSRPRRMRVLCSQGGGKVRGAHLALPLG